jgi:hypothetical protein
MTLFTSVLEHENRGVCPGEKKKKKRKKNLLNAKFQNPLLPTQKQKREDGLAPCACPLVRRWSTFHIHIQEEACN